jgi:dihydrofolate synthase/folylpolyglutamate synthase
MIRAAGPLARENVRPGLSRILLAMRRSGHPEAGFRTLQIAGTNGKGSTAAFAEAVVRRLCAAPVGLYSSPHLLSPEERIRVNGRKISGRALRAGFRAAEELGDPDDPLSYFEKMTWVACDWFRRNGVSVAVMETGLGGRWDATTACRPAVSVITNVGYDHREWLGATLGRIAREKAGILKRGIPLVTGRLRPAARMVVRRRARALECPTWELGREFDWTLRRNGTVAVALPGLRIDGLRLGMCGRFQRDNAAVALAAVWRWAAGRGIPADACAASAREAIASVRLPGRLAPLPARGPGQSWVDGGHNPDAGRALGREIAACPPWGRGRRVVALWSMVADKDAGGYLGAISPSLHGVVTYPLRHDRAASVSTLEARCRERKVPYRIAGDFREGWSMARRWAGKEGVILVCGSFFGAAEAYRLLVGTLP